MNRIAAWCLLAALVACGPEDRVSGPSTNVRPHVLVLIMDTTRGDRCSLNGFERDTTPRLAALAKEGVTFRNAWSPAGWTAPAHASLFTGLRPDRHGCVITRFSRLDDRFTTLAELLRDGGYRTGCFSHNPHLTERFGLVQGFDDVEPLWKTDKGRPRSGKGHELALAWARKIHREGGRFLLFVNDMEPHLPYTPSREFEDRFVPKGADPAEVGKARAFNAAEAMAYTLGSLELPAPRIALLRDLYDAEVAELDEEVGRLVEGLREAGMLDETLLVVTSDHGENIGDHHMANHKSSLHRSIRHVPLFVRLPGVFDGGRTIDEVVRLEDVFPTVLEVCGVESPLDIQGETLTGEIAGRISRAHHAQPGPRLLAIIRSRTPGADTTRIGSSIDAVFDGRHHYIRYSDGREELYDVSLDPAEEQDLSGRAGADLDRLRALLHE
jgi:arylsulfatase A-like enzyme